MKNIVKVCLITLVLTMTSLSAAMADLDEAKSAAIKELLKAMNITENMKTSLLSMKQSLILNSAYLLTETKVTLARDLAEADVDKAVQDFSKDDAGPLRIYELFSETFNIEYIEEKIMIPVYANHYTTGEIQDLITFYKSELGQKTLKLTPVITEQITTQTRDSSQMALSQAKTQLAKELLDKLKTTKQ